MRSRYLERMLMKRRVTVLLTCLLLCFGLLMAGADAAGGGTAAENAAASADTPEKAANQTETHFSDVSPEDYFASAVAWAVEQGITNGTSSTAFSPSLICTRAHVVTFLWRARGCPESSGKNPFSDVRKSAYYYQPVLWAVENSITNGVTEKRFAPYQQCSHAQILTMLWRDAGSPSASSEGKIASANKNHWSKGALAWAEENEMLTGNSGAFQPDAPCSRGNVAFYLYQCGTYRADSEGGTDLENDGILYKAATHDDFASAVVKLIQEYENRVTVTIQDGEYASGRLIVKASTLPSLTAYHAVRVIQDVDGHYVIQFEKDSDAEQCANYLRTLSEVEYAEADGIVTADADSAGAFSSAIA